MHQYIDRKTTKVVTEKIFHDKLIRCIYSDIREKSDLLFRLLISKRISSLIAFVVYDIPGGSLFSGGKSFVENAGIDINECYEPELLTSPRKLFERKIKYWNCRPLNKDSSSIAAPADSRMLAGSLSDTSSFFLKEKFFSYQELIGYHREDLASLFAGGSFAVFRLTPEKYHWNHFPVSGIIEDFYEIDGSCHSCNPAAIVSLATPFSKNKRTVTIINSDVKGGSNVGRVAMFEVAALMIGGIEQLYSEKKYDNPQKLTKGLFVKKGAPKSLYHPGSSVDILLFQKGRMIFSSDIIKNLRRTDVKSRFSAGLGSPLVETEVALRSEIGRAI
jgi:phosphatidylserine decarboxylase